MSKQYEYEALTEYVLIEIPKAEAVFSGIGVPQVDEKLVKPKIGKLISIGNEVYDDKFIIGETYVIDEYAGKTIPDANKTLVLLHYRNVGLLRKEIK